MELLASQLFTFALVMTAFAFLRYFMNREDNSSLNYRKKQSLSNLRENVIKRRLDAIVEERVKHSKRYEIETLCLQAGFRITYVEYVMISISSAIVGSVLMVMILNNPLLGFIFLFLGYMFPKQVITLIKNNRVEKMEKQIGPFMQMVIKRYESTRDFSRALELTTAEFRGEDPLYTELRYTVLDLNLGVPVADAMDGLARRTGNKYMGRLADYYRIASAIGTDDVRKRLLNQAYMQYEENREAKALMKKELSGIRGEAYIMLGSIPMFALYQILTNDDYIPFMTETLMGKIGTAVIFSIFMGALWFINNKITAPLE